MKLRKKVSSQYVKLLWKADSLCHKLLDGYIDNQRLGWGKVQLWQNNLCNYYEEKAEMQ